ncbi:MAG: glycosyltransferase family 39 protein, partial [Clostridia bacterium]|nr:glycosyltransferase family 39 protein [Clostridia bacterium]
LGERQHDVGTFSDTELSHAGRIFQTYNGKLLPETVNGQGYHPPLHYALEALWLRLLTFTGLPFSTATHYVTALTLFYSCALTVVCAKILREFKLGKNAFNASLALVAFHPTFIILAASYNNDLLSALLLLVAALYAVRWYRAPTYKNIVILALALGLGMMSKLSAAYIAPAVALLFLINFIRQKKGKCKLLGQFGVFGVISVPLGTWWSFYMLLKHGRRLGYVMELSRQHEQYIGFRSAAERITGVFHSFSEGIWFARADKGYTNSFFEYNIPSAVVKTSAFGEWDMGKGNAVTEIFAYALIILNVALILFSLWCMAYMAFKKRPGLEKGVKAFLYALWATIVILFVKFCFDYPHNCTMDFRYIAPTAVIGAVFIGAFADSVRSRALKTAIFSACGAFCLFSALLYIFAS